MSNKRSKYQTKLESISLELGRVYPRIQAYQDLGYVVSYIRERKAKCLSLRDVKEIRIEAIKELAGERGVLKSTIYRNLKFATKTDKRGGVDELDLFLMMS